MTLKLRMIALLAAPVLLTACTGTGTVPIAYTGIDSAALLQKNPQDDDHTPLVYVASGVDLTRYTKMVVDPVAIYDGSDQQFGSLSAAGRSSIAGYLGQEFSKAAATRFTLVDAPDPNALRLRLTLTGTETNVPVLATVSKVAPYGAALNLIQGARGKEGTFLGSVSFEVQLYDSTSNRLLESYVSKQYPFAENVFASVGRLDATKAGVRNGAAALLPEIDRLASSTKPSGAAAASAAPPMGH